MELNFLNNLKFYILYEDENFIIINKPFGFVVHGGSGIKFNVVYFLRILYNNFYLNLIYRLDRDISGVLVLSKNNLIFKYFYFIILRGDFVKFYLSFVFGKFYNFYNVVQYSILQNIFYNGKSISLVDSLGKFAETHFLIIGYTFFFSFIYIFLFTGRMHQIRLHLSYIKHPILFDKIYGNLFINKFFDIFFDIPFFLISFKNIFKHPLSNKIICVEYNLDFYLFIFIKILKF